MQNPATEVIDYVKDQVTHPGVTPRKTFKKIKRFRFSENILG